MKTTVKRSKLKRQLYWGYLVLLISVPCVFVAVPIDFFDSGQSVCLSRVFFDVSCYACGMTRALKHLVFFDFSTAWDYNKLSFMVLPIVIWLWIVEILRIKRGIRNLS